MEYLKVSDTEARPYFFSILKIIPENRWRLGFPIFPYGFLFWRPPTQISLEEVPVIGRNNMNAVSGLGNGFDHRINNELFNIKKHVQLDHANVNIGSIQRILGHENRTTTEIYLHSIAAAEREAVKVFEHVTQVSHMSHT